jgi:hypothetical protein
MAEPDSRLVTWANSHSFSYIGRRRNRKAANAGGLFVDAVEGNESPATYAVVLASISVSASSSRTFSRQFRIH